MIVHRRSLDLGRDPLLERFGIVARLVRDDAQLRGVGLDALEGILGGLQFRSERLHLLLELAVLSL